MDFFAAFCLFAAFFAGFAFFAVINLYIGRRALALTNARAGERGRQAQKEQEGDMLALITEVAMQFKEAKEKGEPMKDAAMRILPAAAAAHPIAAMKLGAKLGKQLLGGKGLGNLGDLGALLE